MDKINALQKLNILNKQIKKDLYVNNPRILKFMYNGELGRIFMYSNLKTSGADGNTVKELKVVLFRSR